MCVILRDNQHSCYEIKPHKNLSTFPIILKEEFHTQQKHLEINLLVNMLRIETKEANTFAHCIDHEGTKQQRSTMRNWCALHTSENTQAKGLTD